MFGDHSCTFKYVDFPFLRGADGTQLIKVDETINAKFLYYYLKSVKIENSEKYERHFKYLKTILIPVLPLAKQQEIVLQIEAYEDEILKLQNIMQKSKDKKSEILKRCLD